jgi:hypothetical protein
VQAVIATWCAAGDAGSGDIAARTSSVSTRPASPRTSDTSTKRSVWAAIGAPVISCPAAGAHIRPTAQPSPDSVVVDRPDTTP